MFSSSPISDMDLIRFFFIDIYITSKSESEKLTYRLPRTFSISPMFCMDLVRFFFIFSIPPKVSEKSFDYRLPMTFSISPTEVMDLDRFFMVLFFIIYILQMSW